MQLAPRIIFGTAIAAALATAPLVAGAQESSGNGFLFGAPNGSMSLRFGYAGATAGSDLFSFVTNELSVNKRDFSSFAWGGDIAFALRPHLDLVLSVDVSDASKKSDFRQWQDNAGKPIEQTTSFDRQSWMLSARYYLKPYGRELSRLAWVPTSWAPWVSAGIGRTQYTFKQEGDFVDFKDNNKVFYDAFKSSAWGTSEQLSTGIDWNINQRIALTTQLKYLFGKADLGVDYPGFAPIDLSGFGVSAGFTVRY